MEQIRRGGHKQQHVDLVTLYLLRLPRGWSLGVVEPQLGGFPRSSWDSAQVDLRTGSRGAERSSERMLWSSRLSFDIQSRGKERVSAELVPAYVLMISPRLRPSNDIILQMNNKKAFLRLPYLHVLVFMPFFFLLSNRSLE
jgi:hypothetical protein